MSIIIFIFPISVFVIAIALLILWVQRTYNHWNSRGVQQFPTSFPWGNFWQLIKQQTSFMDIVDGLYKSVNSDFYGIYVFTKPILVIKNIDLINRILIPDFHHFNSHGINCNKVEDPLSASLVGLKGNDWKMMRSMLSPIFSLGKIKQFMPRINECGDRLTESMYKYCQSGESLEIMNFAKQYTISIIASVGFGVQLDTVNLDRDPFTIIAKELVDLNKSGQYRLMVNFFYKEMARTLKIRIASPTAEKLLYSIVNDCIDARETQDLKKPDFIQHLIALMTDGEKYNRPNLTIDEVTAEAFILYIGGFETNATALSCAVFELARNPDALKKLQTEVDEYLENHDNKMVFEGFAEMEYLNKFFNEVLRFYPPIPFNIRECTKKYQIPGHNLIIEEGSTVFIPTSSIHHDPKYFKNPETFDPDRIELSKNVVSLAFIPFGAGPRTCIGLKLGEMIVKTGIVHLVSKYNFELGPNMKRDNFKIDPKSLLYYPKGGIHIKVSHRN